MKLSIKAVLFSALVFPGSGHWLLGRPARGALFAVPTLAGGAYIVADLLQRASLLMAQVESGALAFDPAAISARLNANSEGGAWMTLAITVCVICWCGSIVDALLISPAER